MIGYYFYLVVEFIKTYYQFIALGFSVLLFILDLVILRIRNRQPLMTITSKIRELLPGVIKAAEVSGLPGEEKLAFVVKYIQGYLAHTFPSIEPDKYTSNIVALVEEILSTPQKKGE